VALEDLLSEPFAFVVWDMQKGIAPRTTNYASIIAPIQQLTNAVRSSGDLVIYSRHQSLPLQAEARVALRTQWIRSGRDVSALRTPFMPGNEPWEFVDETAALPTDVVIAKTRPSFFVDTPFRSILGHRGIDAILIAGVTTDVGVLATARDAVMHGIYAVVVSDAVSAFTAEAHDKALADLRSIADVCTSAEALALIRAKRSR
jgi:nicotinamidase-related amidase